MSEYALKLSEEELGRYQFMAETAARSEAELWTRAGIAEGAVVADVGCGPGAVAVVLARLVGPGGRVIAVDRDVEAVEAARTAAGRAGADNISVQVGEAHHTGIDPGSADVVMIRHVLAHNGGLEEAIVAHAATIVRPGGSVYLVDIEGQGFRTRPPDVDVEDLSARYFRWHQQRGNDLSVGLRLDELLRSAGLEVVEFQGQYQIFPVPPGIRPPGWAACQALVADGLATEDDVARWAAAFERIDALAERPKFFAPLFFAVGRRPSGDSLEAPGVTSSGATGRSQPMAEISGYHHVSLSVTDLAKSADWYRQVLGLDSVADIEGDGFQRKRLQAPGTGFTLALTCHDQRTGSRFDERHPGIDHVALRFGGAGDIRALKQRLEELGVEHSEVKESPSGSAMVTLRDPDNIQVEVWGG